MSADLGRSPRQRRPTAHEGRALDAPDRELATRNLHREVNNRIAELSRRFAVGRDLELTIAVVCECGEATCMTLLDVTLREYEDASAQEGRWIIASAHLFEDAVVSCPNGHAIIDDPEGLIRRATSAPPSSNRERQSPPT